MSVSSTDTWSASRDKIVSRALANVGLIGLGEDAEGALRDDAVERLNAIVKALDKEGEFLWRISRLTFTTTTATASYALNATAFAVDEPMRYTRSGETSATQIRPMTRDEYMAMADRTTPGVPSRFLTETTLTGNGRTLLTVSLWPVPDATGDTVEYAGTARAKDLETGALTPDFPTSWARGLEFALTADLAPGAGQPQMQAAYEAKAAQEIGKLVMADVEHQDLQVSPFGGCW